MSTNIVKIRYREISNGTSSIRLNYFGGFDIVDGKRKAIRLIRTLPFHLVTKRKEGRSLPASLQRREGVRLPGGKRRQTSRKRLL